MHLHPVKSLQTLCLLLAMCYCAAGANAAQGEATTLVGRLSLFSPEALLEQFPSMFIRFGIQLALSFEVSASLKTGFCLFTSFLCLEKFLAGFNQAFGGNFSEASSQIYICLNLLFLFVLVCFVFSWTKLIMIFAFSKTLCGLRNGAFPPIFIASKYLFLHL